MIVTPGRSGSEFLLRSLNSNPNFELDGEVFNRSNFDDFSFNHFAKSERPKLNFLFNRARISRLNFNFGLKLLVRKFFERYYQLSVVRGFKISLDQMEAYPMIADFLKRESAKVVYLTSDNKFRICLSLIKARTTNYYHSDKGTNDSKIICDPVEVLKLYKWINKKERAFLQEFGDQALKIMASELFENPLQTCQHISKFVNLEDSQLFQISNLKPTNPDKFEEWVENIGEIRDSFKKAGISLSF